jgi:hypothetical protein
MLTGRIGVEISGLAGARGGRIGLPDSLSEACYGVLAAVILTPKIRKDLVWGEIRSNHVDVG